MRKKKVCRKDYAISGIDYQAMKREQLRDTILCITGLVFLTILTINLFL